ncbi:hypothetical protein SAMN04515647_2369 [Cohaesibacter sp. ES.047]|uniref:DUF6101 family protein n=1 Tax=Cohaesibacter sp. ES.047 TaxID=1798205 RepID=UPI000BB7A2B3|nr:DUF6101 family protein [Cohaesibacter sp. ES.047]SNY92123.1 hypothetical protein SAMN04515647_2369 [Cohaesibacter sp. ES.047]
MRRHDNHKYTEAISYQIEGAARVDPHDLMKYFQSSDIRSKVARLAGQDEADLFGSQVPGMVQIKEDYALVESILTCGLPLIVRVPMSYFKGVGARFVVGKREGSPLICILELVHDDPNLTVPVMATTDLEEAAVDWKSWSRRYGLSMLHQPLDADGYVTVDWERGVPAGLAPGPIKPRRHHAQFAARRPRFLVRRKVGISGELANVSGREIIART